MKQMFYLLLAAILIISSCGSKESGLKLKKDTPEYVLAQALAEKLSYLNPDSNKVLVASKKFDLTVGDVIHELSVGMGNRIDGLKSMNPQQLKQYMQTMANRFGEQKMLTQNAKAAGITTTPAEVDSIMQQQFLRAGGEQKFTDMLGRSGLTLDFYKLDLEKNIKINKYLEQSLKDSLNIDEAKIKAIYDQDKTATVQHILLKTQGKTLDEKQAILKKMEKILAEAKSGKDFGQLANKYSEDPGSNTNGGLYEDFERGAMVGPFDEASFTVPVGEISGIVETRYGYHILKVLNRKKDTTPFEQASINIKNKLLQEKKSSLIPKFIEQLKKEIDFKVNNY